MANFFSASEEEQQEILLTFWQRFKYLIIFVFLSIVLLIVGRDYLSTSSNEKDFITASLYQNYIESNDQKVGEQILSTYPDTMYSDFVRLNEAKRNFENNNSDQAISLLKTVIDNNSEDSFNPLQAAAKTRLVKIYLEKKDYDQALTELENTDELTATMLELKGDAENGLGQFVSARTSYMLALQSTTNQASRALINMKISDLKDEEIE